MSDSMAGAGVISLSGCLNGSLFGDNESTPTPSPVQTIVPYVDVINQDAHPRDVEIHLWRNGERVLRTTVSVGGSPGNVAAESRVSVPPESRDSGRWAIEFKDMRTGEAARWQMEDETDTQGDETALLIVIGGSTLLRVTTAVPLYETDTAD